MCDVGIYLRIIFLVLFLLLLFLYAEQVREGLSAPVALDSLLVARCRKGGVVRPKVGCYYCCCCFCCGLLLLLLPLLLLLVVARSGVLSGPCFTCSVVVGAWICVCWYVGVRACLYVWVCVCVCMCVGSRCATTATSAGS